MGLSSNFQLAPIPDSLNGHTHWQYGKGKHASPARLILGSIVLTVLSDNDRSVCITHLVLDGSSQWVIGQNVTRKSNIERKEENAVVFDADGERDSISMIDHEFLSYLPLNRFNLSRKHGSTLSCLSAVTLDAAPWSEVKKIIDKVHKHVCGHASFTDYKLLLERNGLWNDAISSYLGETVNNCTACRSTAVPQPNRKVSISSLSKEFNEVVCIDHLYLDEIRLTHCMDVVSRYSAAHVVSTATLKDAIVAFEACWVSQFWHPDSIRADTAFMLGDFKKYTEQLGIPLLPVPPGRHSKNAIESKHNIIRSIFIRLKEAAGADFDPKLAAYKSISISNDLYGNETMSAFELAKGFSKPIAAKPIDNVIPDDVRDARDQFQARRKLALILRSKAVTEVPLSVGDLVEVYQKRDHEKRGKWSAPKPITSVNHKARSVTVPGKNGRTINVAFEDTRTAVRQDGFAQMVQDGMDLMTDIIHDQFVSFPTPAEGAVGASESSKEEHDPAVSHATSPDSENSAVDADFSAESSTVVPGIRDRISVFWPLQNQSFIGTVHSEAEDGRLNVHYDDGDVECLNISNERWQFANALAASSSTFPESLKLTSKENEVLFSMVDYFGNKPFLKHHAQGFDQYPLANAYKLEEESFLKTVRPVPHDKIPAGSNIIRSHTLYKVKQNEDGSLKRKARIAPHGNENDFKNDLSKDCATCPPTGLRILESIASLYKWKLHKADVKAAFLQTGQAKRDVYVRPPKESSMKSTHLWLLLTAAYGLVNANAKWQNQSDNVMLDLGLQQSSPIPQLFFKKEGGRLVLLVAKIVDDLKVAGEGNRAELFLEAFDKKFKFGNVNHGPGKLRFFGINTIQNTDHTIETDADDKMEAVVEYPFSRMRRKQFDQPLTKIEKSVFASTNSSLGWIGTAASPFCSFYASYLQQKAP